MELDAALAMIADRRHLVFRRLHLHLVNCFAERDPDRARSRMMCRKLFDDHAFKHEYAMLMGRRFPMLSREDQQEWLGWVDAGPDEEYLSGRELTDADRKAIVQYWQFHRLHWIRDHLAGERRERYEQMRDEGENTTLADLNAYHSPLRFGWESPFTVEDLSALSFVEVIEKVARWRPASEREYGRTPGYKGLADTFGGYVSSRVEELSAQAEKLRDLHPIYVRTFVGQMTDAVKAGRDIDLHAVLGLCAWVVDQPLSTDAPGGEGPAALVDEGWQWTREEVCRLLREVCGASSGEVPRYLLLDHREAIGALLQRLGHDPARSHIVDEDRRSDIRVYDFLTSAINSPRGKAVDALLAYARWIANHVKQTTDGREVVPDGFNGMPEVRAMLEWQIASENGSFEASAMIGAYFGLLRWIDQEWAKTNALRIFDLAQIEQEATCAYGWAAWNAFLVWGEPHGDCYRMLRPQYAYAVAHLSEDEAPTNAEGTPLHRLGQHLVVLYGRGNLAENDDEHWLYEYLQKASTDVRSETISFVGQSLGEGQGVRAEVLERFQKLWDWYWPELGRTDAQARPQSGLFGTWFPCRQFPVEWRLERLEAMLEVLPMPEHAEEICEHLAEVADAHTEAACRILDRMIRADKENWGVYAWREPAKKILALALRGDDTVRKKASQLIDYLGRRGFLEFGELLR